MKNIFFTLTLPVTLIFLLTSSVSCLKKQNLEDQQLGAAIAPEEIQSKMGEALGLSDPYQIKVDEGYALYSYLRAEDSQTISLSQEAVFFKSKSSLQFQVVQSYKDFQTPAYSFSSLVKTFDLENPKSCAKAIPSQCDPHFLIDDYVFNAFVRCRLPGLTCHNLSIEPSSLSLDPKVFFNICENNDACSVATKIIQFDVANANNPNEQGAPSKTHFSFTIAPSLPYTSRVLQSCARGLIQYGNRKILAESCDVVTSASAGQ